MEYFSMEQTKKLTQNKLKQILLNTHRLGEESENIDIKDLIENLKTQLIETSNWIND